MITNEGKRSHGHWKHYQWIVWMVWRIWGRRTNLREVSRPFDTRRPRHPITSCLIVYQHPSNTQNWRIHKKNTKVVVLVDSTSTHNFIDRKLAAPVNWFDYPISNFQVVIVNGNSISCKGKCPSIKLSMGDNFLDSPLYSFL